MSTDVVTLYAVSLPFLGTPQKFIPITAEQANTLMMDADVWMNVSELMEGEDWAISVKEKSNQDTYNEDHVRYYLRVAV